MAQIVVYPVFKENPSNPARVSLQTGVIEVNEMAFQMLTPEQQDFVIAHELGHYKLQTFDEQKADNYAFEQTALKKPNSLWNGFKTVQLISRSDASRVNAARYRALKIAADNGSPDAKKLLKYANATGQNKAVDYLITICLIATILIVFTITRK